MSKAITIQQKGVAQNITVDKLQVHKAGGTAYWVPEDTVELHALIATANGEYSAASAGYYGYGYASVSVPGSSVTGTGSDGNQHVITTDGSGAIVDTKVPSEIRIITPPDYVGPYGDGAYISFEGLTVEAFYADGTSAGMIDPQDLSFPVTVARYDPDADPLVFSMVSDLFGTDIPCSVLLTLSVPIGNPFEYSIEEGAGEHGNATGMGGTDHDAYKAVMIFASSGPNSKYTDGTTEWAIDQYSAEYDGKTVYYEVHEFLDAKDVVPNIGVLLTQDVYWRIAWTIVYGTLSGTSGGVQIPVQYSRPGDGLVLEDSFSISVIQGDASSVSGGGGQTSGGGAGRN